ncbi:hypothetical protein AaE_009461 [Aphanomyces astaci]|uniref:Uncharacterized protein n=1 Tax=Aphanomyces astaci TaxID=112090 RepID=A0A6A5A356_APHAT|nr:hypothetical protein AaE_009461 [Aphanomyces astaci]
MEAALEAEFDALDAEMRTYDSWPSVKTKSRCLVEYASGKSAGTICGSIHWTNHMPNHVMNKHNEVWANTENKAELYERLSREDALPVLRQVARKRVGKAFAARLTTKLPPTNVVNNDHDKNEQSALIQRCLEQGCSISAVLEMQAEVYRLLGGNPIACLKATLQQHQRKHVAQSPGLGDVGCDDDGTVGIDGEGTVRASGLVATEIATADPICEHHGEHSSQGQTAATSLKRVRQPPSQKPNKRSK